MGYQHPGAVCICLFADVCAFIGQYVWAYVCVHILNVLIASLKVNKGKENYIFEHLQTGCRLCCEGPRSGCESPRSGCESLEFNKSNTSFMLFH